MPITKLESRSIKTQQDLAEAWGLRLTPVTKKDGTAKWVESFDIHNVPRGTLLSCGLTFHEAEIFIGAYISGKLACAPGANGS